MPKSNQSIDSVVETPVIDDLNLYGIHISALTAQRIFLFCGQAHNGKSLLAGVLADIASLFDDPTVLSVDAEEGGNHSFAKADKSVRKIQLTETSDYDSLVIALDETNKIKAAVDLPGGSVGSIRRAIVSSNLSTNNVEVIPAIVVGIRENSERVALDWIELAIEMGVKKVYWIWNNQDFSQPDNRQLPKLPANAPAIVEIRIPALKPEIARIIVSEGINPRKILAGEHKDRPELSNRNAIAGLGAWLTEIIRSARPLLDDLKK